ncbi:hypothetical protein EYF80_066010 [Liparis tanakae]|uniref:Uncharacterized protein n=1 Tax=Liparis tanakae TaxID=230148 RepID=A0A4Z2E506_9TELE|nr:hypothetical protein EYF80_066010 [Liparis tanakae]
MEVEDWVGMEVEDWVEVEVEEEEQPRTRKLRMTVRMKRLSDPDGGSGSCSSEPQRLEAEECCHLAEDQRYCICMDDVQARPDHKGLHEEVYRAPRGGLQGSTRRSTGLHEEVYRGPRGGLQGSMRRSTGLHEEVYRAPRGGLQGSTRRSTGVPEGVYRAP